MNKLTFVSQQEKENNIDMKYQIQISRNQHLYNRWPLQSATFGIVL